MAQNELKFPFTEDPDRQSTICVACGNAAEMHLSLLRGASHPGESFCLSCGEEAIRDLRAQSTAKADGVSIHGAHQSFLHTDTPPEDEEHGIIFWESHGWSSDGPFAAG